jgi:hypothetical protein
MLLPALPESTVLGPVTNVNDRCARNKMWKADYPGETDTEVGCDTVGAEMIRGELLKQLG